MRRAKRRRVNGMAVAAGTIRMASGLSFLIAPEIGGRTALGDGCLGVAAIAAAYLLFTRASLGARRRRRFEAVFAFRRGPPALVVAY